MTRPDTSPDASAPPGPVPGDPEGAGDPEGPGDAESAGDPEGPGDPESAGDAEAADWLVGGGEMARLIREKDWSRTPLGPIEEWPQSLRTSVSICLASSFPISISWGPQRTQIYNDGFLPICGDKHPESMGQDFKECWASAWPVVADSFDNATAGRTDLVLNSRMFLDRHGYLEETFFTFTFSPIRDESGGVGGLFEPVTELTQQTQSGSATSSRWTTWPPGSGCAAAVRTRSRHTRRCCCRSTSPGCRIRTACWWRASAPGGRWTSRTGCST
jgi:hypothetical protein